MKELLAFFLRIVVVMVWGVVSAHASPLSTSEKIMELSALASEVSAYCFLEFKEKSEVQQAAYRFAEQSDRLDRLRVAGLSDDAFCAEERYLVDTIFEHLSPLLDLSLIDRQNSRVIPVLRSLEPLKIGGGLSQTSLITALISYVQNANGLIMVFTEQRMSKAARMLLYAVGGAAGGAVVWSVIRTAFRKKAA